MTTRLDDVEPPTPRPPFLPQRPQQRHRVSVPQPMVAWTTFGEVAGG